MESARNVTSGRFALYKYPRDTKEEKELFKLKINVGTSTNGYTFAMDTFKLEMKRCKTVRAERFWNSFPVVIREGEKPSCFKLEIKFIKRVQ